MSATILSAAPSCEPPNEPATEERPDTFGGIVLGLLMGTLFWSVAATVMRLVA
jgi:hypothetical protein